eukprot:gnl/Chilomastix_caulleri/1062.p1 GENE.gnl/Chilomastix_caulleri/1062~~gnl/Chilomastix_caulleri/1062.p1  ORF type:complete len:183 (-),score=34.69 gnl/Chilomastix_caulleri/1062:195-743(-)
MQPRFNGRVINPNQKLVNGHQNIGMPMGLGSALQLPVGGMLEEEFGETMSTGPALPNDSGINLRPPPLPDVIAPKTSRPESDPPWAIELELRKSEPTPVLKNIFEGKSCSKGPLDRLKMSVESEPKVIDLNPDEETLRSGNLVNAALLHKEDGIYYVYPETISSIEEWHHADRFKEICKPNG